MIFVSCICYLKYVIVIPRFVRLSKEKIQELCLPYRWTNCVITILPQPYNVELAQYKLFCAQVYVCEFRQGLYKSNKAPPPINPLLFIPSQDFCCRPQCYMLLCLCVYGLQHGMVTCIIPADYASCLILFSNCK